MLNRNNTILLAPVQSARDHTVQERTRLKGGALIGSERLLTGPFPWFQFSVSVLAQYDLRGLNGCQQDCVVVYASRSQSNQLSSNENRISEAITARTAQGIRGVSMGRVIAIASLIPIKEDYKCPWKRGLCSSYSPPVSVRPTSNPTRARSRARIVTRPNWSVPVNGGIFLKVPNRALQKESHLLVYARGHAQTDNGL